MTDKQTAVPVRVEYMSSDNLPGSVRNVRLTVPQPKEHPDADR